MFGAGNADADLMFVGEAPGASEDEQGVPFVGQAGKLLETLLGEIGMARAEVFICERPEVQAARQPRSRSRSRSRTAREYLYRQVELIQPSVICTLGNFSTKLLRDDPTGITRVHGQPQVLTLGRARGAAVSDLPSRGRAVHAADAGDAARGLRAAAGSCWRRARPPSRSGSRTRSSLAEIRRDARAGEEGATGAVDATSATETAEPDQMGLF